MFFLLFSLLQTAFGISCLDEKGNPTDSWTIYKAPQTADSFLYATGTESLYEPSYSLNDTTQGALSKTLKQLWNSDTSYVLFNDEVPNSSSYNYTVGHTKGILALDSNEGFYIIHSLPQFPTGPSSSSDYQGIPSNTWTYGQNVMCISFPATTFDTIAYSMQLNIPLIYDSRITNEVNLPNLTALVKGRVSQSPICVSHSLLSSGGNSYLLFSKSTQWNKDLWSSCITPFVKKDLIVESWIRGSAIGASCSGMYTVQDAQEISFTWSQYNRNSSEPFQFSSEMDHSKWATSTDGILACAGDINRMTTQYTRGGGAICYRSINNDLASFILKENSC